MREALTELAKVSWWSCTDEQIRNAVTDVHRLLQATEGVWLEAVHDLDTRANAVPLVRADQRAATFLAHTLLKARTRSSIDARAGRALHEGSDPGAGGLPRTGEVLRKGLISRDHADVAVRLLYQIPKALLSQPLPTPVDPSLADDLTFELRLGGHSPWPVAPSDVSDHGTCDEDAANDSAPEAAGPAPAGSQADAPGADSGESGSGSGDTEGEAMLVGEALDLFFAEHSQVLNPDDMRILAKHLLDALLPDRGHTPAAHAKRHLVHATDLEGMVVGKFALDTAEGAVFIAALDHFSAPDPTHTSTALDGTPITVKDERTLSQRQADALGVIARLALGAAQAGTAKSGQPPRVMIHADLRAILDLHHATDNGAADESICTCHLKPEAHRGEPEEAKPEADESEAESEGTTVDGAEPDEADADEPGTKTDVVSTSGCTGSALEGSTALEDSTALDDRAAASADLDGNRPGAGTAFWPTPPPRETHAPSPTATSDDNGCKRGAIRTGVHRGAQIQGIGTIGAGLLHRILCDAVLQTVSLTDSGGVLNLGRDIRTVNAAQRRALVARDRGCVIPGCARPPEHCDAHHVIWWSHGGATDLSNMALLCARHHTEVHLGVWGLIMIEAVPWAIPPIWVDRQQSPLRNQLHHGSDQARWLGTQLRLTLEHIEEPRWENEWMRAERSGPEVTDPPTQTEPTGHTEHGTPNGAESPTQEPETADARAVADPESEPGFTTDPEDEQPPEPSANSPES